MAKSLKLEILSPAKPILKVDAKSICVPAKLGYMEILPAHAAIVSELVAGTVTITPSDSSEKIYYFVFSGYIEVFGEKVTLLADFIETVDSVDRDNAVSIRDEAERRLSTDAKSQKEVDEALIELQRAEARLDFINSSSGT